MRIAIGCDHGGIVLKPSIIEYLSNSGVEYKDFGCFDTNPVDYPVYAKAVAEAVASGEFDKGILLCGTGIGMSICANKVHGIRSAVVSDEFCAEKTAEHNATNILCLGGRVVSPEKAVSLVEIWLKTPFAGGRHQTRIDMISELESEQAKK